MLVVLASWKRAHLATWSVLAMLTRSLLMRRITSSTHARLQSDPPTRPTRQGHILYNRPLLHEGLQSIRGWWSPQYLASDTLPVSSRPWWVVLGVTRAH